MYKMEVLTFSNELVEYFETKKISIINNAIEKLKPYEKIILIKDSDDLFDVSRLTIKE